MSSNELTPDLVHKRAVCLLDVGLMTAHSMEGGRVREVRKSRRRFWRGWYGRNYS